MPALLFGKMVLKSIETLVCFCALCCGSIRCLQSTDNTEKVTCYNKAVNYHSLFQCRYLVP